MTASKWFPLHCHTHYSLQDGLSKPEQVSRRLVDCGHAGSAMTDHGSVSGAAAFMKAFKDTCGACGHQKKSHSSSSAKCLIAGCKCGCFDKAKLKPVLGSEFYVCRGPATDRSKENGRLAHLCVLAKDLDGWRGLVRASSAANRPEHFYRKPRLDLETLASYSRGKWVAFSGHPGSDMADVIFQDPAAAYAAATYEDARKLVKLDWRDEAVELACRYRDLFGRENFFLEVQRIDETNLPAAKAVAHGMRIVSKATGIPCVATADSHYPTRSDQHDHEVIICCLLDKTREEARAIAAAGEDIGFAGFFKSKNYHVPTSEEMEALHTPEELSNSLRIAEMVEPYDILGQPMLPQFPCPDGLSADDYLRKLCREGWERKVLPRLRAGKVWAPEGAATPLGETPPSYDEAVYRERLEHELGVICGAGLSGYFLIVQDFCGFARGNGWKVGKGRGSAAGCMASYLTGITDVDPIVYGLLFERFYNAGRNAPGRVALPDIDCDFEKYRREDVIAYVRKKYGESRVAQMATFTRMQGRGALKDVFRVKGGMPVEEQNRITEWVPDESAISDQLQEMLEESGETSIIRWALEYEAEGLKEWVRMDGQGNLTGPLAKEFAQAIRLEGTLRGSSKHASGLIISACDLADVVPMSYDKGSEQMIVAVDMRDAEAMGLVKFDVLGTTVLDKIRGTVNSARTGRVA